MSTSFCGQAPFGNFYELYSIYHQILITPKPVLKLNHVIYWRFAVFYMLTRVLNYVDEQMQRHIMSGNWRVVRFSIAAIIVESLSRFELGLVRHAHIISRNFMLCLWGGTN
jgi:hypothetical protein